MKRSSILSWQTTATDHGLDENLLFIVGMVTGLYFDHQSLATVGAIVVEHMTVGNDHFLAVTNQLDDQENGLDYNINSYVYKWKTGNLAFSRIFSHLVQWVSKHLPKTG